LSTLPPDKQRQHPCNPVSTSPGGGSFVKPSSATTSGSALSRMPPPSRPLTNGWRIGTSERFRAV
jgi:hypothetical protein